MTRVAPPPADEPSNRWPWVALAAGVLVIVLAVVFFLLNRSTNVNINAEASPTPNQLAAAASPSPPATIVPPTLAAAASPEVSPTAAPSPTPQPSPSPLPPSPSPVEPTAPASPVAEAPPAAGQATPPTVAGQPTAPATGATPPAPTPQAAPGQVTPSPTAFNGQVSTGGGLGNTRADFDAAYGSPVGETPNHLVVFRTSNFEYHVLFVPDLYGRAAVIAQSPAGSAQPFTLEQAQTEAHRLRPRDAQPPNPTPEGNPQFVVERYTSQTLAQALPPEAFSAEGGQPGQFMIVYARDAQDRITRWVIGAGNDANALLQQTD